MVVGAGDAAQAELPKLNVPITGRFLGVMSLSLARNQVLAQTRLVQ
jgi:hypothetical protein